MSMSFVILVRCEAGSLRLVHGVRVEASNENKLSYGGLRRASLGLEM
jgi:hypothetical protein